MKQLFLLVALFVALNIFGQTYKVQNDDGDWTVVQITMDTDKDRFYFYYPATDFTMQFDIEGAYKYDGYFYFVLRDNNYMQTVLYTVPENVHNEDTTMLLLQNTDAMVKFVYIGKMN